MPDLFICFYFLLKKFKKPVSRKKKLYKDFVSKVFLEHVFYEILYNIIKFVDLNDVTTSNKITSYELWKTIFKHFNKINPEEIRKKKGTT